MYFYKEGTLDEGRDGAYEPTDYRNRIVTRYILMKDTYMYPMKAKAFGAS